MGEVPGPARARVDGYVRAVDDAAPGLIAGVHVVGSAVLDDYRDGSDLDVVVELSRRATAAADLDALAAAHRADPGVEATYVPAGELDGPVDPVADGPWGIDGVLHTEERCFQLNPVTWLQLARYAVTVRGARPHPRVDDAAVAAFCTANLAEYWAPLVERYRAKRATLAADEPVDAGAVQWLALGPPRLWHTVRTGEVVSKTRAGELAARQWPDLADPLAEILASRRGEAVTMTARHVGTAIAVGERIAGARIDTLAGGTR